MVLVLLDDGQKETDPLNFCSGRVGVGARAKVVVGAIACTSAAGAPVGEQVSKQARKQRSKYTLARKRASKQTIKKEMDVVRLWPSARKFAPFATHPRCLIFSARAAPCWETSKKHKGGEENGANACMGRMLPRVECVRGGEMALPYF